MLVIGRVIVIVGVIVIRLVIVGVIVIRLVIEEVKVKVIVLVIVLVLVIVIVKVIVTVTLTVTVVALHLRLHALHLTGLHVGDEDHQPTLHLRLRAAGYDITQ